MPDWVSKILPFLDPYPTVVKVIVAAWLIMTAILLSALIVGRAYMSKDRGSPVTTSGTTPAESSAKPPEDPTDTRIFLRQDPNTLFEGLDKLTSYQRDATVKRLYEGKWLRLALPVVDIDSYSDSISVLLRLNNFRLVAASFDKAYEARVNHLQKGEVVAFEGQIAGIDELKIRLKHCCLV